MGSATFTRRFVGPAGHAHGGISAMLADQLVAAAPMAIGQRTVTKSLTIRYLRALPLDEEVELWGVCTPDGDQFKAKFEVRARGEIAVAGTGVLVPYKNLAQRAGITRHGKESARVGHEARRIARAPASRACGSRSGGGCPTSMFSCMP